MRTFYNGMVIDDDYAHYLEDTGRAHVATGGSGPAPDGLPGEWCRMDSGPGNVWLEKQPPKVFLHHVFGYTCTWKEMAMVWGRDDVNMAAVSSLLRDLNAEIIVALEEIPES